MKKILLLSILFVTVFCNAQDMRTVFVNMPDSLSPLFTKVDREDFADFLESNMKAEVKNRFEGTSEMKKLTKDYLSLQMSLVSTLQMKLLPVDGSSPIICMIKTTNAPVSDSYIEFYTTDWQPLNSADYLTLPETELFFIVNDTINLEEQKLARQRIDMDLVKADLSPDDNTIRFTYTTIDHLDDGSSDALSPFLKHAPLVYEWSGGKFIRRD